MAKRQAKVMAISSRGGHWVELLRLRAAFQGTKTLFVTTVPEYRTMIADGRFRTVVEATRSEKFRLFVLALQILWILLLERPSVIVTTGAAPGYFAVRIGKLLGIKTLWIDSIANADELSLSGQLASRHADVVLTQWEHLACPGVAEFRGAVI